MSYNLLNDEQIHNSKSLCNPNVMNKDLMSVSSFNDESEISSNTSHKRSRKATEDQFLMDKINININTGNELALNEQILLSNEGNNDNNININSNVPSSKKIDSNINNSCSNINNTIYEDDSLNNISFSYNNFSSKISCLIHLSDNNFENDEDNEIKHTFRKSRIWRNFLYQSNDNENTEDSYLSNKKFGMRKNNEIITYLINLYIFSEFNNLECIKNDERLKVYFIPKNKEQNFFTYNKEEVIQNLKISSENIENFELFLNGINDFFKEQDFLIVDNFNKKYKCRKNTNIFLLTLLLITLLTSFIFIILKNDIFVGKIQFIRYLVLFTLLILIGLNIFYDVKQIKKRNTVFLHLVYNYLYYMLNNHKKISIYVEEWNKNFFKELKIRVNVPISLNYILFNLNPYQQIEIKDLDMQMFTDKYFEKDVSQMDKKVLDEFYKIRNSLVSNHHNI